VLPAVLILMVASLAGAAAQDSTGVISGIVIDSASGLPLAGAMVRIDGLSGIARTEADGAFRIESVPPGAQWLDVSLAGYGRARPKVEVRAGAVAAVSVKLVAGATPYLETVEVRPGANVADAAAPAARVLDARDLEHLRGVLADDPFRAVHALPGVAAGDDFRSEFYVRGSDSRHVGMSMDGISIPWPLHAVRGRTDTGSIAVINSDALDRLTLESGSYAQRAGSRTGGWLDFSLRDGSRKQFSMRGAASVTNASVIAEGPLAEGRGAWLATARQSYLNWLLHRIDSETDASAIGFFDHQARFVFDVTSRHQLQVSALAGRAGYDEHDPTPGANSLSEADSHTAIVTAGIRSIYSNTTLLQRIGFVSQGFGNTGDFRQVLGEGALHEWLYNASAATRLSSDFLFEGSLEVRRQRESRTLGRFGRFGSGVILLNEDTFSGEAWLSSGHAQFTWQLSPSIVLSPGVRLGYSTLTNDRVAGPWLQAMWRRGRVDVKAAAGLYPQFPEFDQVLGASGNSRLLPERARHLDATIGANFLDLRWQASVYHRRERDMVRLEDSEPRLVGMLLVNPVAPRHENALDGSSYGLELSLEGSRHGISGWISYAYGRSRYDDRLTGESFWGDYDQRHTVNVVGRYQFSRTTGFGLKWRYGSNVPVAGYLAERGDTWLVTARRNEGRLPEYSRLDIRADRMFTMGKTRLTVFGEIVNVLDRANVGPADPSIRLRTFEAVRVTETLLPRVPAVGVMIAF
jgi:outer membrane cobalamin receptor